MTGVMKVVVTWFSDDRGHEGKDSELLKGIVHVGCGVTRLREHACMLKYCARVAVSDRYELRLQLTLRKSKRENLLVLRN